MPLRIAIISPTFGGYGGLEIFSLELLRGLGACPGIEARVYFKRTAACEVQPRLAEAVAAFAERVQWVDRGSAALRDAIRWADVVHAQNASPDVVLWSKLLRRKLLVNVINHRLAGQSLHQRLWDFCLRRADRRFFISDFVRRRWEGQRVRAGSEVVFPICELAGEVSPPEERRGFVFAARWIANKGVETLVEAYARARLEPAAWPLTLIGDGPLRGTIEQRVAALGLRGVGMPGFLSHEAKTRAIQAARWMVVPPNTREDFGLTAIEARHVGVPCIITTDGGVPEAAGEEALRCTPGDVDGLAGCLRTAAEMSPADYAGRATRTRATLLPLLRGADFYAQAYRQMASR